MHELIIQDDLIGMQSELATHPESLHQKNENGLPPLYTAALYRKPAVVTWLVEHGAIVDIFACGYLGDSATAEKLLKQKPELVNATTPDGRTALHYSAMAGHADVAEVLLQYNADADATDHRGRTPLIEACHGGPWKTVAAEDVVQLLLTHGAAIDLFTAAALGRVELVDRLLVEHPQLIDGVNPEGKTALYMAVSNNQLEAVKRLIECGADVNHCDAVGIAALHRTSGQCSEELIQHLIDHGAKAHLCCHVACGDVDGCRTILATNPGAVDEVFYEYNAVGYAIHCWQLEILRLLLKSGASLSTDDRQHILRISQNDEALLQELLAYES